MITPATNEPDAIRLVMLNGRLLPAGDARISPLGDGFMYGLGLFETIRVLGGRLAFFPEHIDRLRHGAAELGLRAALSLHELRARCGQCIAANRLDDAALKLVVFQDADGPGELIVPRVAAYSPEQYARGFRLQAVHEAGCDPALVRHKTLNYLRCIQAKRAAERAGFDEALFVDANGALREGAISNIFVVKSGTVHTPSLAQGVLPGIARAAVLRLERGNIHEGPIATAQLFAADEVFVTNSLMGVMPVARVDQRSYDLAHSPCTRIISEKFRALEAQSAMAG